jgi:hypothetical protein
VVASLLGSELANRGQNTKGITSQHNDIARLAVDDTRDLGIRDELDRISATRVLRDTDIVVIRSPIRRAIDDVLEDRAEPDSVKDLGLFLGGEVDAFGVTPSFDVEDAGIGPDVFVVADEETVGVGGEGCLAGTGETEEEGDVTVLHANVGGGVKRKLTEFDRLEIMLAKPKHKNKSAYSVTEKTTTTNAP